MGCKILHSVIVFGHVRHMKSCFNVRFLPRAGDDGRLSARQRQHVRVFYIVFVLTDCYIAVRLEKYTGAGEKLDLEICRMLAGKMPVTYVMKNGQNQASLKRKPSLQTKRIQK